jgi:hypothetical protein
MSEQTTAWTAKWKKNLHPGGQLVEHWHKARAELERIRDRRHRSKRKADDFRDEAHEIVERVIEDLKEAGFADSLAGVIVSALLPPRSDDPIADRAYWKGRIKQEIGRAKRQWCEMPPVRQRVGYDDQMEIAREVIAWFETTYPDVKAMRFTAEEFVRDKRKAV